MKVAVIYHCNQWQEYSSFRFIGVVALEDLGEALNKIQKECNYSDEDMNTYIYYSCRWEVCH